jgi:hypothetical protein
MLVSVYEMVILPKVKNVFEKFYPDNPSMYRVYWPMAPYVVFMKNSKKLVSVY